jgi:hypothetical protein
MLKDRKDYQKAQYLKRKVLKTGVEKVNVENSTPVETVEIQHQVSTSISDPIKSMKDKLSKTNPKGKQLDYEGQLRSPQFIRNGKYTKEHKDYMINMQPVWDRERAKRIALQPWREMKVA